MSKNVKDCALLQEVISTYDEKDSTSINFKRNEYSKELTNNIKGMKIGIPKEYSNPQKVFVFQFFGQLLFPPPWSDGSRAMVHLAMLHERRRCSGGNVVSVHLAMMH